jgi:hypothetical protein
VRGRDRRLRDRAWQRASSSDEAARSFEALVEFSRWAEDRHEVQLAAALERSRVGLAQDLPRVAEANARLRARLGPLQEGGEMLGFEGGRVARTPSGDEREVTLAKDAAPFVEPGDFLRAERTAGTELRVICIYPPQTTRLGQLD